MSKTIILKLVNIKYTGKSIGDDLKIVTDILGQNFEIAIKLKRGNTAKPDFEIGHVVINKKVLVIPATIQIIERDVLFNDTGSGKIKIKINPDASFPQQSSHIIEVKEFRGFQTNTQAQFELIIDARAVEKNNTTTFKGKSIKWWEQRKEIKMYTFHGVNGKEDYNRYDAHIRKIVAKWNKEFFDDLFPPDEPLDPNLVKAMIYQESRVGYDPGAPVNIMQVGNYGDPSLKTLRGELKEYWFYRGKIQELKYKNAKVTTIEESIKWGTRWLYHKAQKNIGETRRVWKSWQDAVQGYGPPRKGYSESVWSIYTKGIKKEKKNTFKLWAVGIVMILASTAFAFQTAQASLINVISNSLSPYDRLFIDDIEAEYYSDHSLFWSIISREKDWWEDLHVGRKQGGVIQWLKIEKKPIEQSILSVRFVRVGGFENPILEVYGETHVGNGTLYLYEIRNTDVRQLVSVPGVVDSYPDGAMNPENVEKYGYMQCGPIFKNGALNSEYKDLNNDELNDVYLSGELNMLCETNNDTDGDGHMDQVIVASKRVEKVFFWDIYSQQFQESKKM